MSDIPPFTPGVIEQTSKILGELFTGSELTRLLAEVPLRQDPGEGITKWRRIACAVSAHQGAAGQGNALVKLVTVAMSPDRTIDRKPAADGKRDQLNQVLSLAGLRVREDGKIARTQRARTDDEAISRSRRLRTHLERRGSHPDVLVYCRPDLLRGDYYEAVFEAIKGLGSRIRRMSGLDSDGYALVDAAMCGSHPVILLNTLRTRTERDQQLGSANLAKGLFSAFRNPAAHEPRLEWQMSEQDALDVFGTLSLLHRRLDAAIVPDQALAGLTENELASTTHSGQRVRPPRYEE